MNYSLEISNLIERDLIRNDYPFEFLNKMTDQEINQWEKEVKEILLEEGVHNTFPEWNSAFLREIIDRDILYNLFKLT